MSGYSYRWQAVTSIPIQSTFQYSNVSLLPQDGPNSVDSWLKFRRSTGLTEGQYKFIVQATQDQKRTPKRPVGHGSDPQTDGTYPER